jgi:lipopolysaccharide export system protein LptA
VSGSLRRRCAVALIIAAQASGFAFAAGKTSSSTPILPGANSKEPISIDANKLNYYDKEQKAVYTGNVVAIQGDSKLTCSVLTIFLAKTDAPAASAPAATAATVAPAAATGSSQVKHMEAAGPVTVVSKTQVATGDRGTYDKEQNKVWLFDNVTLSDGGNVTKGDKLTYDLTTGEAIVEAGHDGPRVQALFIQGSSGPATDSADKSAKKEPTTAANDKKPAKKKTPADAATPKP